MIDFKERYKTTLKISGDLWTVYKKAIGEIDKVLTLDEMRQDNWWDQKFKEFQEIVKPYIGTTHEFYANQYSVACMDDLNAVWKLKNIKKT